MKRALVTLVVASFVLVVAGCATSPHATAVKIYLQQNNKPKLLKEAKAWVESEPQNPKAYMWLALAYAINGEYIQSAETYQKAFQMDTTLRDPQRIAQVYKTAGGPAMGVEGILTTLRNAAVMAAKQGKVDKALSYLDTGIWLSPTEGKLYLLKASLLKKKGDPSYVEVLRQGVKMAPEDPELNYHLGVALKDEKQYDEALRYLEKAAKLKPDDAKIPFNLGVVYFEKEEYDKAVEQFRKALAIDSTNADAWLNLGITAVKQDDYATAVEAFRHYTRLVPDDAQGFYFLAVALLNLKEEGQKAQNLQAALQAIQKAIELDPGNPDYYNIAGMVYKQMGDTKKSLEMFRKAQQLERQKK